MRRGELALPFVLFCGTVRAYAVTTMSHGQHYPTLGEACIYDAEAKHWVAFDTPTAIYACHQVEELLPTLDAVEQHVRTRGHYAVGFVSYEAAPACDPAITVHPDPDPTPLCWFALYPAHRTVDRPEAATTPPPQVEWTPSVTEESYRQALSQIHDLIRSGDTYQVNYTLRLSTDRADGNPFARFTSMLHAQSDAYAAYIDTGRWVIASASPELFFTRHGRTLVSRPMKGTAPRGPTTEADQALARELHASEKCRAENVMIVDMVRNDLGRIATAGSVEATSLFDIEKYPTIWQMTSTVACQTDASLASTFKALFPPASITGAPKIHTCQIIHDLETTPRRIYTGAVGMLRPDGYTQFNVAIRSLLVDRERDRAEYGIGAGIVWDSLAALEYEECLAKAAILTAPPPPFELLETIHWDGSEMRRLSYHLARLSRSADYFDIPLDSPAIEQAIQQAAHHGSPARIRLTVAHDGTPTVTTAPLPAPDSRPVRLALDHTPIDPANPFLYHKTTQRDRYAEARNTAPDADDVLLWNPHGEITESTIANVAIMRGSQLCTPPVPCGLLAGTLRQQMIDSGELHEAPITLDELKCAPRIVLINSLRGIREATLLPAPNPSGASLSK